MEVQITYEIEGIPRPQGSKRHVGGGVMVESSKHVANWRAYAKLKAVQAMGFIERAVKPTPIRIGVSFRFDRPKKHFTAKGLKHDAPKSHTNTPDADKLLRALLDSMSGVVFEDDSQVSEIAVEKVYSKGAVTIVTVYW